jgi:hypothetical protein
MPAPDPTETAVALAGECEAGLFQRWPNVDA